ncbi:MAG: NfeD family protein [Anaerolineales bacterium]
MGIIISPAVAYLLIFIGVMLLLVMFNDTKYSWQKVSVMAFCILAGLAEFIYLHGNPWAFLVVVLSPLPFFIATQQGRRNNPLYMLTIAMLTIGSAYLFTDNLYRPLAKLGPAGMLSVFGGLFIWILAFRGRMNDNAPIIGDTLVGMTGEVFVEIEPFSLGSVRIEGDIWQARSKETLPVGTLVRVLRQDGITLTVKKVENIPSTKK